MSSVRYLSGAAVWPYLATRLPLLLAGVLSVALVPLNKYVPRFWISPGLDRTIDAFSRWDAWQYTRIALNGYPEGEPARTAFFPLFPTLIRAVAELMGRTDRPGLFLASVIVANVCVLLATMALIALVGLDLEPDDARRSAWYLLAFPTTLFLSAGYSEALFLLLTVGAVLAVRTDHWLWAASLGLLAALTRPVGVVICVPIVIEAWLAWRATRLWRWRPAAAVVAPLVGLGGWMVFLEARFHDPLAFLHAQAGWDRVLTLPWDAFLRFFQGRITPAPIVDLLFTLFGLGVALLAWRWLRPAYAGYMTVMLAVPLATGSLVSMPRFLLVMFPMYLVLAILGRRAAVHDTLLTIGMGMAGLYMVLYAQWYWVA